MEILLWSLLWVYLWEVFGEDFVSCRKCFENVFVRKVVYVSFIVFKYSVNKRLGDNVDWKDSLLYFRFLMESVSYYREL